MKQKDSHSPLVETKNEAREIALLNAQKKQLTAQLRESRSAGHIISRLIRILRSVDSSITWKIGRGVAKALSIVMLKRIKSGFIDEVDLIESEFIEFSKSIGINYDLINPQDQGKQDKTDIKVHRRYKEFDRATESLLKSELLKYRAGNRSVEKTLVSIIMPTHNRVHTLEAAIDSVISQEHKNWELLIVDDGSTDSTDIVVSNYLSDSRIKCSRIEKSGVGVARNTALRASKGDVIAFLDSDNEWYPDYLSLVVSAYQKYDVSVLYSGMELYARGKTVGFRGDHFNFEACLEGNYVDLNCFSHLKVNGDMTQFSPSIKRYNDWDYILSITKDNSVRYLPFVGVRYFINSSEDQISVKEPMIYRQLVRNIHSSTYSINQNEPPSILELLKDISLNIVIFLSAENKHKPSSDYYVGMSLKHALERAGQSASLCFFGEGVNSNNVDVAISIRGVDYHFPLKGAVNVLWSVDSPQEADLSEI